MKETRAHKALRKAFPLAHWCRIESYTSVGAYDTNGCFNNKDIWVENKQVNKPKRKDTLIKPEIRGSQIIWGVQRRRVGGKTFFAIMVGRDIHIVPGELTSMLIVGVTLQKLKEISIPLKNIFK